MVKSFLGAILVIFFVFGFFNAFFLIFWKIIKQRSHHLYTKQLQTPTNRSFLKEWGNLPLLIYYLSPIFRNTPYKSEKFIYYFFSIFYLKKLKITLNFIKNCKLLCFREKPNNSFFKQKVYLFNKIPKKKRNRRDYTDSRRSHSLQLRGSVLFHRTRRR